MVAPDPKRWLATTAVSWIWCLIPLVTFGFGTVPVMLYAAVRQRSLLQGLSVVGYTIAAGVALATGGEDAPVDLHSERKVARAEARKIVDRNPDLARSLHIGRVDLPDRTFPDGGLVDVNSVPVNSFAKATGLPDDLAERIVKARQTMGGFVSVADLSVSLNLPPHALEHLDDVLIFLPPTDKPFIRP